MSARPYEPGRAAGALRVLKLGLQEAIRLATQVTASESKASNAARVGRRRGTAGRSIGGDESAVVVLWIAGPLLDMALPVVVCGHRHRRRRLTASSSSSKARHGRGTVG